MNKYIFIAIVATTLSLGFSNHVFAGCPEFPGNCPLPVSPPFTHAWPLDLPAPGEPENAPHGGIIDVGQPCPPFQDC